MRIAKIFFATLLFVLVPFSANAAIYQAGEAQTIRADETISENVYLAGASVVSRGTIEGDLIGAGSSVVLSGTVQDDVAFAGGSIDLIGDVEDDVRIVGGNVTISGNIEGELIVAGGSVHVFPDARIGDNLVVAGGRVVVDGTVNGDMHVAGGEVDVNGSIDGMVNGWVEDLRFGDSSTVLGPVQYRSPQPAHIASGATLSGPVHFEMAQQSDDIKRMKTDVQEGFIAFMQTFWLVKMLALIAAGLCLVYMFPLQSTLAVRETVDDFWVNVLWGLLILTITPFFAATLFATGIGWILGILVLTVFTLMLFLSGIGGAVAFGFWLEKLIMERRKDEMQDNIAVDWRAVLIGVVLLAFISLIPVFGWLFTFVWFLAMFGSLVKWIARQNGLEM